MFGRREAQRTQMFIDNICDLRASLRIVFTVSGRTLSIDEREVVLG
jgi:hypothetical protein